MLSLQPVERVEALLDLLQPPGLGLDPVEVGAQLAAEVVRARRADARSALGERVELGVDAGDLRRAPASAAASALRARRRPRRSPAIARRAPRRAAARSALGVAQALALGGELGLLGRVGLGGLDLGELEAQQVEVALARALALAQLGELALDARRPRRGRSR